MPLPLSASFSIVESLRLPVPTPSTDRKTPRLALLLDQPHERVLAGDADVEVAVGGQDHAVDAAVDEVLARRSGRRAGCRAAPLVEPPASQVGDRAGDRRLVGRQAWTAARGRWRRRRRRSRRGRARRARSRACACALCTSGSLSAGSSSRTRRAGTPGCAGRARAAGARAAWMPISASRCAGFHGHAATSVVMANGSSPSGAA